MNVPPAVSAEIALPPVAEVNCAPVTVMAGLVLPGFAPSERSLAVSVKLPFALNVTGKLCVPSTSAGLAGKVAVASLEVRLTVSLIPLTRFQFTSTALTVTLNPLKAFCPLGVPDLPVVVPGAAVSPGTRSCSFAKSPGFTTTFALVLAVNVLAASVAVTVRVPALLKVRLDNVRVPPTNVTLPAVAPLSLAIAALPSELVIVTFATELATTFQLASTALTTMPLPIAAPAI